MSTMCCIINHGHPCSQMERFNEDKRDQNTQQQSVAGLNSKLNRHHPPGQKALPTPPPTCVPPAPPQTPVIPAINQSPPEVYILVAPFSSLMIKITGGPHIEYMAQFIRPDGPNPAAGFNQLDLLAAIDLCAQAKGLIERLESEAGRNGSGFSVVNDFFVGEAAMNAHNVRG